MESKVRRMGGSNQEWGLSGIKCYPRNTNGDLTDCNPLSVAPAVISSPTAEFLAACVRSPALICPSCVTLTQAADAGLWDRLFRDKKGKNYGVVELLICSCQEIKDSGEKTSTWNDKILKKINAERVAGGWSSQGQSWTARLGLTHYSCHCWWRNLKALHLC